MAMTKEQKLKAKKLKDQLKKYRIEQRTTTVREVDFTKGLNVLLPELLSIQKEFPGNASIEAIWGRKLRLTITHRLSSEEIRKALENAKDKEKKELEKKEQRMAGRANSLKKKAEKLKEEFGNRRPF